VKGGRGGRQELCCLLKLIAGSNQFQDRLQWDAEWRWWRIAKDILLLVSETSIRFRMVERNGSLSIKWKAEL
jgi:hypothetical protein